MSYVQYARGSTQVAVARLMDEGHHAAEISRRLDRDRSNIASAVRLLKERAAKAGDSPEHGLTHPVAPGFTTKRVSTMYNSEGGITAQWHIQEPEKQKIQEFIDEFVSAYSETMKGVHKPVKPPKVVDEDYAACYLIGDHHLGMYAWGEETGEDYDTDIAEEILSSAVDRLVASQAINSGTALLINLGDFLHANDTTSLTPASKNLLDTDGRFGRVVRVAARLYKRMVARLLQKHQEVIIINVRGNHDPDVSLLLNELLKGYYENEPRVTVKDNYSPMIWHRFGECLITLHHGDGINPQRLYEAVTATLPKEWGETSYRVCWTGHLHSKLSVDLGGMNFERWNVLPPGDAWHTKHGYVNTEQQRSMSCVILHKDYGEELRYKVGIRRIKHG